MVMVLIEIWAISGVVGMATNLLLVGVVRINKMTTLTEGLAYFLAKSIKFYTNRFSAAMRTTSLRIVHVLLATLPLKSVCLLTGFLFIG